MKCRRNFHRGSSPRLSLSKRSLGYLLLGIWLWALSIAPVAAHGYLIRSIPENRGVLDRAPIRLQYWFSEDLEPRFSELLLRDATGDIIASGGVDANNSTLLTLTLPPNTLADGAYVVELRPAFASDAHVVVSSQVFFIGTEIAGFESIAASDAAQPLEAVWKFLLLLALFVLFGVYTVYAYVLIPAWGNPQYKAGWLPPRIIDRLNRIIWAGIVLAVAANILALLQQTMVFFNLDIAQVMSGNLWQVVRQGSRFGDMWNLRMLLLILLIAMHTMSRVYRESAPETVRAFWTANVWLTALLIGMQATTSHAAGSLILPWLAMFMHWLHSLSVAFWIGGVAVLVLILPVALAPYTHLERRQALGVVMMRFSRLLTAAVLVVIFTGIYNAANWFFSPAEVATRYGGSLVLKVLMVALLLIIGAIHHLTLRPVLAVGIEHLLARVLPLNITMRFMRLYFAMVRGVETFSHTLRLEVVFAGITLALAALLSATPVPQPAFLQNDTPIPTATQTVNNIAITLSISPGGTGVNTYDVVLQANGSPFTGAQVELQVVSPDLDRRTVWQRAEAVDEGLYVAADDAITTVGRWWTLVDISAPDGTFTRAFFEWQITNDAAVFQFLPPSLLHIIAGVGILLSVALLAFAPTKRLLKALHVTRSGLAVAVLAFAISGGVLGFAAWFLVNQQLEYQAQLFPPPTIINARPPDADSLRQGETLLTDHCPDWSTAADYVVFILRLDTLRDEELYRVTTGGWRTLAPCAETPTAADRWHIVNYVRTLRRFVTDGDSVGDE